MRPHLRYRLAALPLAACLLAAQASGPSFDAASIKPSPPLGASYARGCHGGPGTGDPGLWRCTNATLQMLIMRAYDLKGYQLIAPGWASEASFNISATLPPASSREQFRLMIRALLADRFALQFHWTKKKMAALDLVVARGGPKLSQTTPTPAPQGYPRISEDCYGCMSINAVGAHYRDANGPIKALVATISAQLGEPVTDKTGLEGQYDIDLYWNSGAGVGRSPAADSASEPGLTVEEAVQQQLGLKLVPTQSLIDVLVVDHATRPTPN